MSDKELFLRSAEEAGIKIENFSVTKVTDYSQVTTFLKKLREYKVHLGMDMSSLTCSGNVEIMCVESKHICLWEKDNVSSDYFKFKNLFILSRELDDPRSSLEMFFEADDDIEWLAAYSTVKYPYMDALNGTYLGLEIENEGKIIYDSRRIDELLDLEEQSWDDHEIVVPQFRKIVRNTKRGILAYVNLQECTIRFDGQEILSKVSNFDCSEFLKAFSTDYKIIE